MIVTDLISPYDGLYLNCRKSSIKIMIVTYTGLLYLCLVEYCRKSSIKIRIVTLFHYYDNLGKMNCKKNYLLKQGLNEFLS